MRKRSTGWIAALLVAFFAAGAYAQDSGEMYYYEMFVPPDIDGYANPVEDTPRPMRMLGDGFGSRKAGDFANGAGLQLDGTARFMDTGAHGRNGFVVPLRTDQGSIYLRMKVNKDTTGPSTSSTNYPFTFGFMIQGTGWTGAIAADVDTNKIQLLTGAPLGTAVSIDMTTWRIVRFQVDNRTAVHGGTEGAARMRVFIDNVADTDTPVIDWTGTSGWWATVLQNEAVWGYLDADSIFYILGTDAKTTQADFDVDWIRITRAEDLAGNTNHPHGLVPPQDNNVWVTACDWRVYPHYYTNTVVLKNGVTATPSTIAYQVINTSYDSEDEMTWTVEEVDSGGAATDYAWLDLDKTGGTLAATQGTGEVLTVSFNSGVSTLPAGWTVAYLKFTNDCDPAQTETRRIYVAVNDPASWVVYEYCGDVPPTQADSAGTDQRFRAWGYDNAGTPQGNTEADNAYTSTVGAVVDDANAQNGKAFQIATTYDDYFHVFHSDDNAGSGADNGLAGVPVIDRLVGATVVARMKTVKPDVDTNWDGGALMGVMLTGNETLWLNPRGENNGDAWATIRCRASDNGFALMDGLRKNNHGILVDAVKTTISPVGTYHVVRMAMVPGINDSTRLASPAIPSGCGNFYGRKIMMWLDEAGGWASSLPFVVVDNKEAAQQTSDYQLYNGFMFGVQHRRMALDYSWDWITFTNAGAFGPGEEQAVIGRSLIPTSSRCVTPPPPPTCNEALWPDADQDGDVDQDDFAQFQACYSGDYDYTTPPENCICFDPDESGKIDADDFAAFTSCATGPGIPVTVATAGDCAALIMNTWEANDGALGHLCGSLLGTDDWRCTTDLEPCFMSYGPYVVMDAGDYVARLYLAIDDISGDDDEICNIDVYTPQGGVLTLVTLTRSDWTAAGVYQRFDVPFTNPGNGYRGEFRVWYVGNAQLDLDKIELMKLPTPGPVPGIPYTMDTFYGGLDGWSASTWVAGGYGPGVCIWDSSMGNPPGSVKSSGAGGTSNTDRCTREGGIVEKAISTVGYSNLWLHYDLYLNTNQTGAPCTGGCSGMELEGDCADKLAVYCSTDGGTSWILLEQVYANTVTQGVGLARTVKLPAAADNNADVMLRFKTQFNSNVDAGYVDNIGLSEAE